ncbi:MAG TPA: PSD1 and planctomycete cytochrome C domain-containing protein [Tepidisphaeraceae bacterium]|nr:PSD1 and planctomycete cytochrome C domain-containing protein [Tepidisphaeraceae bacterium]
MRKPWMILVIFLPGAFALATIRPARAADGPNKDGVEFFETKIRPVLIESCYGCHSAKAAKVKGKLRLDSFEAMEKGGDSGKPAVVAGNVDGSRLILAIRYTDKSADDPLLMPPPKDGKSRKLADGAIADFEKWVALGAPHPASFDKAPAADIAAARGAGAQEHWSFKKPVEPPIPAVKDAAWIKNPIDAFVLAKLEAKGLKPAPTADKRTLLRRAYFDLIGLPPTPGEVDAFLADKSSDAFAKVVDHLLASPHYGERWGRYWLDVARYADTKGYVFQEERRYPYAYTYRDYVIRSFNEDKPYDQFLKEQIAADLMPLGDDKRPLAAEGYLTLGRRFLNAKPDIMDDRIDVVCRGMMAITVGCARCHDHKFDPIPTKDYYSLYAIFSNSPEAKDPPLIGEPPHDAAYEAFQKELKKRQKDVEDFRRQKFDEMAPALRSEKQIADYLLATQLPKTDRRAYLSGAGLNPFMVNRWQMYLKVAGEKHDAVFAAWRAYAAIPAGDFAAKAPAVAGELAGGVAKQPVNPLVLKAFESEPPKSLREVADHYGKLLASHDKPELIADADEEALRQVLRGEGAPANIALADLEHLFKTDSRDRERALNKKIEQFKATNPSAPPRAMALEDAKNIEPQRVFHRGNPGTPGDPVKPHFLTILSGGNPKPFTQGSGRLELAQAIASRDNPLTARVWVNRVWLHHFGFGIVRTPSDFGTRSDPPTHPQLLDYLALRLMDNGWSTKKLHRLIMLSAAYQMSSDAAPGTEQRDPQNLLLSHMNRRRLDFEATRDALLYVTGKLDETVYGRSVDITTDPSPDRRTVYAFIDRQNLPGLFRAFDFASPDATSAQRFTTTVPQQALFMMNSPFVARQAQRLTQRPDVAGNSDTRQRITALYRDLFDRVPMADELALGEKFIASEETTPRQEPVWQYGFSEYDAGAQRVKNFTPLAHFTGSAWQAGPKIPDPTNGWVTLTAAGGHPGNDANHAAVRRWIAPRDATLRISGTVSHKDLRGDGVHALIVSSRSGELASWNVFHGEAQTALDGIEVKKGNTIDFVVDCRSEPSYDSFGWAPVIQVSGAPAIAGQGPVREWNAAADFAGPRAADHSPSAWEKYAQVLMESNEFVFVD